MSLKETLMADLKVAMREKNVEKRNVIRTLQAAVKQIEIDEKTTLDDEAVLAVIKKQAKQRKESIVDFEKADRPDEVAELKKELAIIEVYLPQQMGRAEVEAIAKEVIAQTGATSPKEMGQVMGQMMARIQGQADGRLVSQVVRELLQG